MSKNIPPPDSAAAFDELLGLETEWNLKSLGHLTDSGRPVVIYGAGLMAVVAYKFLTAKGFGDIRLTVDSSYESIRTPELNGLEMLDSRELDSRLEAYDLVIGFEAASHHPRPFLEDKFSRAAGFYETLSEIMSLHNVEPLEADFFRARFQEFKAVHQSLADSLSRSSLTAFLRAKLTLDSSGLELLVRTPPYFQTDFLRWSDDEAFFDAGAYDGDTIRNFLEFTGGRYTYIWAAEPDEGNYQKLAAFVAERGLKNVELIRAGVAAGRGRAAFSDGLGTCSKVDKGTGGAKGYIDMETLDNIVGGAGPVTCLKMDIEGGELEALQGAAYTIKKDRPKLAICAYHRADDLLTLPAVIKELVHEYKLHFRLHLALTIDAVLYATV